MIQIQETLTGYQSPILQLSLAPDDPRARSFAFAVNDTSLSGAFFFFCISEM
jgi:hypothetical protein